MIDLYFIRHGQTQWNADKKIQGHTDIPLNNVGKKQIASRIMPNNLSSMHWFCSPLTRAVQTAQLLNLNIETTPALIEMNWGDWEGQTLANLRATLGETLTQNERQGLDLLPTNGESPRQVATRLTQWAGYLENQGKANTHFGAVCHKGVIRAVYALASNWDMKNKPPHKLDFDCIQHFKFTEGQWSIAQLNIPLLASET